MMVEANGQRAVARNAATNRDARIGVVIAEHEYSVGRGRRERPGADQEVIVVGDVTVVYGYGDLFEFVIARPQPCHSSWQGRPS
jgi:hypothetical protein